MTLGITKEILKEMYLDNDKKAKEIADFFGCSVNHIRGLLRKYDLDNKYKFDCELTNLQVDLIIGSALGDGHLDKRNGSTSLNVSHAENQKDYCQLKFDIVKDLCNHKELRFRDRSKEKDAKRQSQYAFNSKYVTSMNKYHDMSNIELMQNLNANSLTIWMMDDGHKHERKGKNKNPFYELSIGRFDNDEVEFAGEMFRKNFNIESGVKYNEKWKKAHHSITFDVENSFLLSQIMKNSDFGYIAEQSMSYKLINTIHINRITKNYKTVKENPHLFVN